ncbi:MAG: dipeptide ABC transporter ATP-binding protein [Devosia indica]
MQPQNLAEIRNLDIAFADVRVVEGLDLDIPAGKTLCLVGESGCGKSVTAKALLQVIDHPGRVAGGAIRFRQGTGNEIDIAATPPRSAAMRALRGADIALIHQEPMSFLSPLYTIGNQIAEALTLHRKVSKADARQAAIAMLTEVGMPYPERRVDSYTFQLSGGQRQRAMIAMALINRPRLLIADEPTTALDVTTQANILDLMRRLQADSGMSMLFITHDLGVVAEIADEVAVMYLGRIVERGPVDEVLGSPQHPYTQGLLASMPRLDGDFKAPLQAIPGMVPPPVRKPSGCAFHPRCSRALKGICDKIEPLQIATGPDRQVACHAFGAEAARFAVPPEQPQKAGLAGASEPSRQPSGRALLEVAHLDKHFAVRAGFFQRRIGAIRAVNDVSFDIFAGETLGLVGESGCGKSTLGQTIVGLHPADGGDMTYTPRNGMPVDLRSARGAVARQLKTDIRMVFQDPTGSLNPRMRVRDIIGEVLQVNGVAKPEIEVRVQKLLARVGLSPDYAERYPHAFSGGQRQRIAIARALASNPQLVIADEAVSALDVSVQTQIINMMRELQAELGLTYLFVSHDLGVVANISDRVAVMYAGRIVEIGPTNAIFRSPRHPYTEALLAAIPGRHQRGGAGRIRLEGHVPDPAHPQPGCAFADRCRYAQHACREVPPPMAGTQEHGFACIRADELTLRAVHQERALESA